MRRGSWGRAAIALLVAATAWSYVGSSPTRANAPSADYYRVAATPPGGRVVFPGWTLATDIVRADDGSFLVRLERRAPIFNTLLGVAIARLNADATLDTTFGPGGTTPGIAPIDLTKYDQASQPIEPLVALPGGRYLVGSRMYLSDGTPDLAYGFQGFTALLAGSFMGGAYVSLIRTSTDRVVVVQADLSTGDCTYYRLGAVGIVDQTIFTAAPCGNVIPLQLPGVDTMLLSYGPGAGSPFTLFFIRPDGTADATHGVAGVITSSASSLGTVMGAQLTPAGNDIIIGTDSSSGTSVMALRLDGTLDPTFAAQPTGFLLFAGSLVGLHVDDQGRILLSMSHGFTSAAGAGFNLFRLAANGGPDPSFNPTSVNRPWLSAFEMGVSSPGTAEGHLALADGRVIERFSGDRSSSPTFDASIVVLSPAVPGSGPTPTIATIPSLGASATQPAQRGRRLTVP